MKGFLAQFSFGTVVALVLLGLPGCAKRTLGHRPLAIFGLVTAPGRQADPGGWFVWVSSHAIVLRPTVTTTNDVGAFALSDGLRPGQYIFSLEKGNLKFKSPVIVKRQVAWYKVVELTDGAGADAVPAAGRHGSKGTVVFGILTKADGVTPLDNMGIRFRRLTGTGLLPHSDWIAVTNRLGTFALRTRLRPGTYVVTARRMPSARVPDPNDNNVAQTIVIIRPSSGRWVVVHLRTPSGSVSGRVVDYSGRPVTRALMGFYGNTNHAVYLAGTDRHGRYSIRNVLPDTYILSVGSAERVVTVGNGRVKRNFRIGRWAR